MRILIVSIICLSVGFSAGVWLAPRFGDGPSAPPEFVDFSSVSEEMRTHYQDPKNLERLQDQYELQEKMVSEATARMVAKMEARVALKPPEGVPAFPLQVFVPDDGVHWPKGLEHIDGGEALMAAKGNWVVLNVWASWCAPCLMEMPDLDVAFDRYSEFGVSVFTVNADPQGKDTAARAEALFEERGITRLHPLIAEGASIDQFLSAFGGSRFDIQFPTTLIFAPGGEPYGAIYGYDAKHVGAWASEDAVAFFAGLSQSTQ